MSAPVATTDRINRRARAWLALVVCGVGVVFLPPIAGVLMLALQVLGDSSYDLSRFALSDFPRAILALAVAGTFAGYLYGLVPAVLSAALLCWVIFSGRRLSFGWIAVAILLGGFGGFAFMSLLIGGITSLTLMVTSLLGAGFLWLALKRYARRQGGMNGMGA